MKIVMTDAWKTPRNKLPENVEINYGDLIKLKKSENFWVVVTQILSPNTFVGVISNNLVFPTPYQIDDLISFKRENIMCLRKLNNSNVYKCR